MVKVSQISSSKVSKYQNIIFNLSSTECGTLDDFFFIFILDVEMLITDYIPWKFLITAFIQTCKVHIYISSHHHWTKCSF